MSPRAEPSPAIQRNSRHVLQRIRESRVGLSRHEFLTHNGHRLRDVLQVTGQLVVQRRPKTGDRELFEFAGAFLRVPVIDNRLFAARCADVPSKGSCAHADGAESGRGLHFGWFYARPDPL